MHHQTKFVVVRQFNVLIGFWPVSFFLFEYSQDLKSSGFYVPVDPFRIISLLVCPFTYILMVSGQTHQYFLQIIDYNILSYISLPTYYRVFGHPRVIISHEIDITGSF